MSNRYALIDEDGVVVNVVEWDGLADWSPSEGLEAVEVAAQVGRDWRREGEAWTAPLTERL